MLSMLGNFVQFQHLSSGILAWYPPDYEFHPLFGPDLVRYDSDELEFSQEGT